MILGCHSALRNSVETRARSADRSRASRELGGRTESYKVILANHDRLSSLRQSKRSDRVL